MHGVRGPDRCKEKLTIFVALGVRRLHLLDVHAIDERNHIGIGGTARPTTRCSPPSACWRSVAAHRAPQSVGSASPCALRANPSRTPTAPVLLHSRPAAQHFAPTQCRRRPNSAPRVAPACARCSPIAPGWFNPQARKRARSPTRLEARGLSAADGSDSTKVHSPEPRGSQ